ncbi:hypothetical protein Btru_009048 [Bulinus truncatus]|nr:hypothetical protein Btru_009048 [Bulinus truncatus]
MEPQKIPSWGAPAAGGVKSSPSCHSPQTPSPSPSSFIQGRQQSSNRYQRRSPYHMNTSLSKNDTLDNLKNEDSPKSFQNFSSGNPYQNCGNKFSSDNPYHKNHNGIYQGRNNSTPNTRQFSHSSPVVSNGPQPRFSPHTPSRNHSQNFHTPSPVRFANDSSNNHSNYVKRPYTPRNKGLRNPGGSDNIRDYISHSMLEDPWKDVPATLIMQQN